MSPKDKLTHQQFRNDKWANTFQKINPNYNSVRKVAKYFSKGNM